MKILFTIVAALLTGVGGHFLNRRWDRALFFFGITIVWLASATVFRMLNGVSPDGISFGPDLKLMSLPMVGFLVIFGLSLVISIYDVIKPNIGQQYISNLQGRVGATLFSLILIAPLGLFYWGVFTSLWLKHENGLPPTFERPSYSSSYFSKYVYLGKSDSAMRDLSAPPEGDKIISGQFIYEGKPVKGIQLSVILNNEFKVTDLETDSDGFFYIKVDQQDWFVPLVIVGNWKGAPKGAEHFIIVKPNEPKFVSGERYHDRIFYQDEGGYSVKATKPESLKPLTFIIEENVQFQWPQEGKGAQIASLENDVISWGSVDYANRYLLEISRLERNGSSTGIYPVISKEIVGANTFPLSELLFAEVNAGETEYQSEIFAFDRDGNLISRSAEHSLDALFKLPDGVVLAEDTPRHSSTSSPIISQVEINLMAKNGGRFEAADLLIQDNLFDQAEAVLEKVNGNAEPGKLLALHGYIQASKGNCVQANNYFQRAIDEAGKHCILERYRVACGF